MMSPSTARKLDLASVAVWVVTLLVGLATFRDYGVAWDEQGEAVFGDLLIQYYTSGFRDVSAFEFVNFRYYGGGFELPAALLARLLPFDVYETRHALSLLVGLAALIATTRLTRKLAGPRAALLAAALLALNPCWYGLTLIDARDIPLAAGILGCLLFSLRMLDELPRIRWQSAVGFGAVLGWTMSVRVGAVIALLFLCIPIALWLALRARSGAALIELARDGSRFVLALMPALLVAYAVIAVFWPWAVQAPLNPLDALLMFSRFPYEGTVLFQGEVIAAKALPASYLPVYLGVTQPESLLVGLALAVLLALGALVQRRCAFDLRTIGVATVAFSAAFPVLYFVVARPVAYNSMRHFLFVVPLVTVLAAIAFDQVLASPRLRLPLAAALALLLVLQASAVIALHPNQYVYFNRLAGGPRGAQGRYELDYWGTSLREATQRLVHKLERSGDVPAAGASFKAHVCGNVWSAAHFFPAWLTPTDDLSKADFHIAIGQYYCLHQPGARPVLEVKRAGAVLSFVDDLRGAR